jgi:hypothetical protein
MDRGHDLHDIAHVRGADALIVARLEDLHPEALHVLRPALGHGR